MAEAVPHQKYILLVDDDESLRGSVEEFLTHIGFHVITADDGKKAIDVFGRKRKQIGLIITDIFMPILDGIELVHQIRLADIEFPIMAISGEVSQTIQRVLDSFSVPLFHKPLDFPAIGEHLKSALGHA